MVRFPSIGCALPILILSLATAGGAHAACPRDGQPVGKLQSLDVATAKGKVHFKVEVVSTEQGRERGLMCRKTMARDRGMLFDFKQVAPVAFWMKNTILPLDMLFIAQDGRDLLEVKQHAAIAACCLTSSRSRPSPSG